MIVTIMLYIRDGYPPGHYADSKTYENTLTSTRNNRRLSKSYKSVVSMILTIKLTAHNVVLESYSS